MTLNPAASSSGSSWHWLPLERNSSGDVRPGQLEESQIIYILSPRCYNAADCFA
jgi:hypothetical protein